MNEIFLPYGAGLVCKTLEEKNRTIAELAAVPDYRLFCRASVWIIENFKDRADIASIDAVLLSSFKIQNAIAKVAILRSAYNIRHCLKYWHNLRDNAHAHLTRVEPLQVKRIMAGLYEEVRNAAVLFPRFTPRHSLWQNFPQEHLWPRPRWNS